MIIGRATSSCTYYIMIISGKVDEEAYFTGIDVDFDETFQKKPRKDASKCIMFVK
jgi:hypothetical protein